MKEKDLKILFKKSVSVFFILFLVGISHYAHAESATEDVALIHNEDLNSFFKKGHVSMQCVGGALWSPFLVNTSWPDINYYQTNLRIGLMLSDPHKPKYFLRGNMEGIIEITYSDIHKGSGSFLYGAGFLFRYNFVSPKTKIFPYIQVGAGVVYNDIYKDRTQSIVGQSIEFTVRGSIGTRYFWADNWSIDVEAVFEHVSSAGMSDRNGGLNAAGGFIGFTYFFPQL
jgi:hypothetical protein